jgi:hypothetical protein
MNAYLKSLFLVYQLAGKIPLVCPTGARPIRRSEKIGGEKL